MSELRQVNEAVTELRSIYEKNDGEFKSFSVEQKEKVAKIEKFLDDNEEKNVKLVKEIEESKAKSHELELKYNELEKQIVGIPSSSDSKKVEACKHELKSLARYMEVGKEIMHPEEIKYLRSDNNVDGGFLCTDQIDVEFLKKLTETSNVRSVARVKSLGKRALSMPARASIVSAGYAGQNELNVLSNSTYGRELISAERLSVTCQITLEEIQDADFDMEQAIQSDVIETFGQIESRNFVIGDGVEKPQGFNSASADLTSINSGVANDISLDNLLELQGELKTGYSGIFAMNRRTISSLRRKKGGDGQYLWVVGNIAAGIPNQFAGDNYISLIDMDDIAPNAYPVVYADFRRLYTIVDRTGMSMIRNEATGARTALIELTFHRRSGGRVVQKEAGVRLKVST